MLPQIKFSINYTGNVIRRTLHLCHISVMHISHTTTPQMCCIGLKLGVCARHATWHNGCIAMFKEPALWHNTFTIYKSSHQKKVYWSARIHNCLPVRRQQWNNSQLVVRVPKVVRKKSFTPLHRYQYSSHLIINSVPHGYGDFFFIYTQSETAATGLLVSLKCTSI